jgi:hypothetical protein
METVDMAEEKNPLDFDEPKDGGLIPSSSKDENYENEDLEDDQAEEEVDSGEEEDLDEVDEEVTSGRKGASNLPLDVIEEAIGYGLTSREIENLGSEENIAAVLAILDRQMDAANSRNSDSVFGDDSDDPFADSEVNTGANSEVAELRKQVEQMRRELSSRRDDSTSEKLFGLLEDDYSELFGAIGDDLTKTQERNRNKVLQELDTLKAGYKARKRAIPSDRRLFKQAVRSVFGDYESKVVKKKFSESAKKRKSQFINRVNSRDARRPKDGRVSAIDSVKKFLADRGYSDLDTVETFE